MLSEDKFFQTNDKKKIWQRYCGFLDLSIDEFMEIQNRLLMEQIELVSGSILGKKILGGNKSKSIEEFRRTVPLTTYDDYEPYLTERREDVLAEKPLFWCHSAGRGGKFKWIPYTDRAMEIIIKRSFAVFILAGAHSKGEINFWPGCRALTMFPIGDYISGALMNYVNDHFSIQIIPPLDKSREMEFQERIAKGFQISLCTGVDVISSIGSVLVKMGESMTQHAQRIRLSPNMLRPPVLMRLLTAYFQSKTARRPMLPRDLWKAKAIVSAGVDVNIYKDKIAYYWGQTPFENYGCTEESVLAMQAWNKKWMTFVPDCAFLEFIPDDERIKNKETPEYKPKTVLLSEVEAGKTYEVVITHFYGMPLLRYRLRDLVTFISSGDNEVAIKLPQLIFKTRCDDIVTLSGLAQLDERTIWQAIENAHLDNNGWTARTENENNQDYLGIYIESREVLTSQEIASTIDNQLKVIDTDYKDIGEMLGLNPVKVTLLSPGTFQRYFEERQKEGVDLAELKPPHINASDKVIQRLLLSNCR